MKRNNYICNMEKVDIYDFRFGIEKGTNDEINIEVRNYIINLLQSKGLSQKTFGLCDEPFDKYFEICNIDERGVSSVKYPLNHFHIDVNENTSTLKKRVYFSSISVSYIGGFYYLCCLAQSTNRKIQEGAETVVYKVSVDEIQPTIDIIFENVEF